MKNTFVRRVGGRLVAVSVGVLGAVSASQAAVDTAAVTTAITDAGAAIAVVGAAVLVMFVGGKVFKWIRAAM
ncbi:hypothetical protein GCM10027046_04250 [Uliginosibacterium flavum]|uniref:Major capsid protein n=1 Tax=Uliginosibacterium flavum TaxID=1396831 RepID=A0ABV2TJB1_9RHOO